MRRALRTCAIAIASLGVTTGTATAAPVQQLTPRQITVAVGESKGFLLLSNDRARHRWRWLTVPRHSIARALPIQSVPMNDIVNGPAGRQSVYVAGVRPGTTRAVVGYFPAGASTPTKRVAVRVVVTAG